MSLGSYPDFHFFPRVGVFEGFFWPPCSFVIYLPYSMHAFSCLFSLRYFMITQPLGSNVSLGSYPSCLANYIVNIYTPNKVWSMVVRTHADCIQFAPCILLCLALFGRNMPSIVQKASSGKCSHYACLIACVFFYASAFWRRKIFFLRTNVVRE